MRTNRPQPITSRTQRGISSRRYQSRAPRAPSTRTASATTSLCDGTAKQCAVQTAALDTRARRAFLLGDKSETADSRSPCILCCSGFDSVPVRPAWTASAAGYQGWCRAAAITTAGGGRAGYAARGGPDKDCFPDWPIDGSRCGRDDCMPGDCRTEQRRDSRKYGERRQEWRLFCYFWTYASTARVIWKGFFRARLSLVEESRRAL